MQTCLICGASVRAVFALTVLAKHHVQYFHCGDCGFVCTEKPYWLEEAYSESISVTDTGVLERNWSLSAKLACFLYGCMDARGTYLDVAGGYGILTRMMRDYGFNYYWEDKFSPNLVARGFEAARAREPFVALSGFEVMEHTPDPAEFVREIMTRHDCRTFIFSTVTYPGLGPPSPDWSYLSPMTGQHISFFQQRTLTRLAQRLGLGFLSSGGVHVFTDRNLRNVSLFPVLVSKLAFALAQAIRLRLGSRAGDDNQKLAEEMGRK